MEQSKSVYSKNRYSIRAVAERAGALTLLGVSLLLGGCGNASSNPEGSSTRTPQGQETPFTPTTTPGATITSEGSSTRTTQGQETPFAPTTTPGATITFNALGGGSNVIEVYPGVGDTPQDKAYNGTYYSGETAPIVCETTGRTVTSNTAAGEQYRQSDEWYKLQTPPGTQPEYATAVYADEHGSVPQC